MATKAVSLRLFTSEEKAFLSSLISLPPKARFPEDIVDNFCKKFKRKPVAVYQYVTRERKRLIMMEKSVTPDVPVVTTPTKDLSTLRRNEFVIPVTNWELRTENGTTSLILKFK